MFREEALWIANVLARENLTPETFIFDVGSCTEEYRCIEQPFIDYYIFKPLRDRGSRIVYADAQAAKGVDVVFDFASSFSDEESLADYWGRCDIVICANLLEHVENRSIVLDRLKRLLSPRGLLVLTVPNQYRYHPHPIDTMYRPSDKDLEDLFDKKAYSVVASTTMEVQGEPAMVPWSRQEWVVNLFFRGVKRLTALGPGRLNQRQLKNKVAVIALKRKGSP